MEREDGALLGRKPPKAALDLIPVGDDRIVGVDRGLGGEDANVGGPSARPRRLRVAAVHEDALYPDIEAVRIAEPRQLAPGDHQRLLQRILGPIDVPEDPLCEREEPVAIRPGQDGERLPVTVLRLLHEVAIHLHRPSGTPIGGAYQQYRAVAVPACSIWIAEDKEEPRVWCPGLLRVRSA